MEQQTIYLKQMCCQRCIEAVTDELNKLGLKIVSVTLGEAVFYGNKNKQQKNLEGNLIKRGFEIILSEEQRLVERIKTNVIQLIHPSQKKEEHLKIKLKEFLEEKINKPYRTLQKVFLLETNLTIEKYIILQRIEKAKALIEEGELNFSEISLSLNYQTQQHLSAQFKKITGISMKSYRELKNSDRKAIDKV